MRRLLFLAIVLSALLWTVAAMPGVGNVASGFSRTSDVASDLGWTSDVASDFPVHRSIAEGGRLISAEANPDGPSQADLKWRAQLHTIGIVTESIWKSASVHVELGATRAACPAETVLAFSSPDPPLASVPHYLRHTPLLI